MIGRRNIFREFVTIHRGTRGGGGVTTIGDRNVFMAYVHVAHDCHVGNNTIFGNMATLGGHVDGGGLRQHQRRLRRAPVLPRRPARVHRRLLGGHQGRAAVRADRRQPAGAHLRRQHHRPACAAASRRTTISKLKRAFRYLLQSKLNTTQRARSRSSRTSRWPAPKCSTSSTSSDARERGVILRRATRPVATGRMFAEPTSMKLGLIAGNGRFPFLVLDAARRAGHDVTIIAIKEEAFPELDDASPRGRRSRRCTGSRSASSGSASAC